MSSCFEQRLFCPCGKYSLWDDGCRSPFFIRNNPCPKCGRDANTFSTKVVRWIFDEPFSWRNLFSKRAGHWEESIFEREKGGSR
jgi:hypothetical protein